MGDVELDDEIQSLSEDGVNGEESVHTMTVKLLGAMCEFLECVHEKRVPFSTTPEMSTAEAVSTHASDATIHRWDPFYPYMQCLPGSQSTSTTSGECSTRQAEIPVKRALVYSETGLEYRLERSCSRRFKEKLLGNSSLGNQIHEQGKWSKALECFVQQRTDILSLQQNFEEQDYNFVLAWSDILLAQLYQSKGGEDMLEEAMNLRKEVLDCVLSLQSSHELLVRVCKTYYYTALYEWGAASMYSEAKNEAIQEYAKFMRCDERDAEVQLCFLLCLDHESYGSSESLVWVQEANRQRQIYSPDAEKNWMLYFLAYEANLLVKHGNCLDGLEVLDALAKKLVQSNNRDGLDSPKLSRNFYDLVDESLTLCSAYSSGLESIGTVENNENEDRIEENLASATGIIVGNSQTLLCLGLQSKLIQSPVGLEQKLNALPLSCREAFRKNSNDGCACLERGEWDKAIFNFELCVELLLNKVEPGERRPEILDACKWLVVWASLPLANIYQFKKKKFKRSLELWRQIQKRIPEPEDSTSELSDIVRTAVWTQEYQYVTSDLKNTELNNLVVRKVHEEYGVFQDEKATENYLLTQLSYVHNDNGSNVDALSFIQNAIQCLSRRDDEVGMMNVAFEAYCSDLIGLPQDAHEIVLKYKNEHVTDEEVKSKITYPLLVSLEEAYPTLKNKYSGAKSSMMPDLDMLRHFSKKSEDPTRIRKRDKVARMISGLRDKESGDYIKTLEKAIQLYEKSCMVAEIGKEINLIGDFQDSKFEYDEYFYLTLFCEFWCEGYLSSVEYLNYEQVKAFQEHINFKRTVAYLEKFVEVSPPPFKSKDAAKAKARMTELYAALDLKYFSYLFVLFKQVTVLIDQYSDASVQKQITVLWHNSLKQLHAYLDIKQKVPLPGEMPLELLPVQRYGKEAVSAYALLLRNVENARSDAQWLNYLKDHEALYSALQDYHLRRAKLYEMLCNPFGFEDTDGEIERKTNICQWNAFMYAEGERSRSMLHQLRDSNKPNASDEWGFDASNEFTLKAIQEYCGTLLPENTIFVMYSPMVRQECAFNIYIIHQGKLSVKKCHMDRGNEESTSFRTPKGGLHVLDDKLAALYDYYLESNRPLKKKEKPLASNYVNNSLYLEDLEFLYDKLIRPFAAELQKIQEKSHHQLILVPCELITKVPFAALRDKDTGKYLIESNTISVIPSLRVLQVCTQRLLELRNSPPYKLGKGSIVALGDPAYVACESCDTERALLEGTRQEVDDIAKLFGKTAPDHVVKLLWEEATTGELLRWAARPSQASGFRQAVVHIGAHGMIDEDDHRNNVLRMACLGAAIKPPNHASSSRSDEVRTLGVERAQHYDYCSDEDDGSDSGDEDIEAILKRSKSNRFRGSTNFSENAHDLWMSHLSSPEWMWRAELVVLSACQTSRGRLTTEGVLSMARSFIIAGVPCVVATLWEVDDKTTPELMRVFYKKLHEGKDVASAFRSAMCACIVNHRDEVSKWAAFNVVGVPSLCIPEGLQEK